METLLNLDAPPVSNENPNENPLALVGMAMSGFQQDDSLRERVADLCQLHLYHVWLHERAINLNQGARLGARNRTARALATFIKSGQL